MQSVNAPMEVYDVYGQIGAGGGGSVYRAYHKRLQKEVVIKKLHSENIPEEIRRVEVDILKNLHHPYLPQVFDYYVIDGIGYTVMDFIQGESLAQKLEAGVRFSEAKVIKYAKQLCEALDYLHSRSIPIIHGDIKPDNIMVTPEDNICLIDFNISGTSKGEKAVTFGYTPGYGAPEQYEAFLRLKQNRQAWSNSANPPVNTAGDATEVLQNAGQETGDKTEVLNCGAQETEDKTEVLNCGAQETEDKTEVLNCGAQENEDRTEVLNFHGGEEQTPGRGAAPVKGNVIGEQWELGEGIPIDKRSDIYSVGATLYHLYTGKRIDQSNQTLLKARTGDGFIFILNKALQQNPAKRFQSAGDMLKALQAVHKMDKRYRSMQLRHNLFLALDICLIVMGILLIYFGNTTRRLEIEAQYDAYVEEMEEFQGGTELEEFDEIYLSAVGLFPERIEAYFQRSLYLYELKEYEECIGYIEDDVLSIPEVYQQNNIADIYYILGNSYFELELYEEAYQGFRNAIHYDDQNCAFYVDQAITLARLGEVEKAQEALAAAEDLDITSDNYYLVTGEIDIANGDYDSAEENLSRCIEETEDDYVMLRAYVMRSVIYKYREVTQENIDGNISLLLEAKQALPLESQIMIMERLAQAYIDGLSLTDDTAYAEQAIGVFHEIIDMGWDNYNTYNNLVILYQKVGNIEEAEATLAVMEEKYPDNYNVYKRYAYLEIAIQESRSMEERDYSTFITYYDKAFELYREEMGENQTDGEMVLLEQVYQQLRDGSWIR